MTTWDFPTKKRHNTLLIAKKDGIVLFCPQFVLPLQKFCKIEYGNHRDSDKRRGDTEAPRV